jgi:hypothetical protein
MTLSLDQAASAFGWTVDVPSSGDPDQFSGPQQVIFTDGASRQASCPGARGAWRVIAGLSLPQLGHRVKGNQGCAGNRRERRTLEHDRRACPLWTTGRPMKAGGTSGWPTAEGETARVMQRSPAGLFNGVALAGDLRHSPGQGDGGRALVRSALFPRRLDPYR